MQTNPPMLVLVTHSPICLSEALRNVVDYVPMRGIGARTRSAAIMVAYIPMRDVGNSATSATSSDTGTSIGSAPGSASNFSGGI
jgi:hypothetical protein